MGRSHTRGLIREAGRLRDVAWRRLSRLLEEPGFEAFVRESQGFTLDVGAQRIFPRWEEIPRTPGLIGYYFKKRVAVILVEEDRVADAASYLASLGAGVRILQPARWPYCIGACT